MDQLTSLLQRVAVRHRVPGYIRFELPDELCVDPAAETLERGLQELEGAYRVALYRSQRKLSIRYLEELCSPAIIARRLRALIEVLTRHGAIVRTERPRGWRGALERARDARPVQRVRQYVQEYRQAAKLLSQSARSRLPAAIASNPEHLVINFLNDLVAFYLIKVHWDRIVHQWLRQPVKYRYQWLTALYLVFLLVRYRKVGLKG